MGLFSKKSYVCEKCGKEFQKRINLNGNLCDECWNQEANAKRELEEAVRGYINYYSDVFFKSYTSDDMRKIIDHRDDLLEKFQHDAGITRAELMNASDNYKQLTDEQAAEVLIRAANSSVSSTMGAVYSGRFFCPTHYEGMIVDAEDVFAVGFTSDYKLQAGSSEVILCAVFTNDPYVPVFPMIYVGKTGFFEITKSKKGRASVAALFEAMCPNLTYPVGDIKQLKKQIKQDGTVKGNLDSKFMLDQISNASVSSGIFDTKKMHSDLFAGSAKMLDRIGYIQENEVNAILKMDKMFNRNFWNKHIKRLSGE